MKRTLLFFFFVLLFSTAAYAETTFQFQMPGVQAPGGDDVGAFRIVFLYGKNNSVSGLDMGLLSFSEATNQSGLSLNMGVGHVTGTSSGAACGLVNIHRGTDSGFNGAFINIVKSITSGVNVGFVNITEDYSAVDIGGLSISDKSKAQISFVNITQELEGLQIGFLNVAPNGFLPVFPVFNFPKK